jgi:hypothetical protein
MTDELASPNAQFAVAILAALDELGLPWVGTLHLNCPTCGGAAVFFFERGDKTRRVEPRVDWRCYGDGCDLPAEFAE